MASSPPSSKTLNEYYNDSPQVLIKDLKGTLYSFPSNHYSNGSGGTSASAGDDWTFTNGRKFDSAQFNGKTFGPWAETYKVDVNNYNNNLGGTIHTDDDNNANSANNITDLNNHSTPPGYDKKSGGNYKDGGSYGYLVCRVSTSSRYNFHFSVYVKKESRNDFLKDLLNASGANKTVLLQMQSKDCWYGNQRYADYCVTTCDSGLTSDGTVSSNCRAGADQWCRDDSTRIGSTYDKPVSTSADSKCINSLKNGTFDENLYGFCKSNDRIASTYCADIRQNVGSSNAKTELNKFLYGNYCNLDANINSSGCSDVRTTCNTTASLVTDTAPYNCNSLVKNLSNDSNIIMMTSKLDLTKVPATINKTALLNSFNNASTNAVEDALCSMATNAPDAVCQSYLSSNFSAIVKTNASFPILLMYFSGGLNFNSKVGMDSYNSSKLTFKMGNDSKVGFNSTPVAISAPWTAKLYTYLTPSTTTDYLFKANADDLCKVYLNNNLIISTWDSPGTTGFSTYITLDPSKGPYLLYVEYGDTGGDAIIEIQYTTKALVGTGAISSAAYSLLTVLPSGAPISGTSPITSANVSANTLYMSQFNPYVMAATGRKTQSIKYCTTSNRFASDVNCTGNSANDYKGINTSYNTDPTFKTNMINYCGTDTNFIDIPFCKGDSALANAYSNGINKNSVIYDSANTAINSAIAKYCALPVNNTYAAGASTANMFCKTNDNINNTNYNDTNKQSLNPSYASTLRATRLKYIQDTIAESIKSGGALSQDVIDYITTDYLTLQKNAGTILYPDSNIVTPELTLFCENSDPSLTSNLCSSVYNNDTYKKGTSLTASRNRINDFANCIANNAFMGKSGTANDATCISKRDAPATYARYLPLAIQYCGDGDNVVSPECTTFYNTIQGNINNAMDTNYTNAVKNLTRSSFTNKENFDGGCGCDNENCNGGCYDECSSQYESDYSFLFIMLICFILILGCISGYSSYYGQSKCNSNNYHHVPMYSRE